MMNAQQGNEVCSETIVIRSNEDWTRVVRRMQYDGSTYSILDEQRQTSPRRANIEQGANLFALAGASS